MKSLNKLLFSLLLSVSWLSFASAQYCSGGPTSPADSNVESVNLPGDGLTINHTGCAGGTGITGVEDLTSQIADVTPGNTYTVTIQFGTCGGNFAGAGEAWIDWDQNQTFDPSESLGTWSGTPPVAASTFTFTVPMTAATGLTRMRVMQEEGGATPLDPCGTYSWGSVMDFGIALGVTCLPPGGVSFSNILPSSVDLSFTSLSGLTNIEYGLAGFTPGTGTTVNGLTSSPYTITGLVSGSDYELYLIDDCGGGNLSPAAGPIPFAPASYCVDGGPSSTDDSNIEAISITGDNLPINWIGCGSGNGEGGYTGVRDETQTLVDLTPGNTYTINVTFGSCDVNGTNWAGAGQVWIDWDGDLTFDATDTVGSGWAGTGPAPTSFTFTVPATAPIGLTRMRVMQWEGGSLPLDPCGSFTWGSVTDFGVAIGVTCLPPGGVNFTNITSSSADVNFTSVSGLSNLEYGVAGFTPGSGTTMTGVTTPVNLSSLMDNTDYDVYLTDDCGGGNLSPAAGPFRFTTACVNFLAPYTEDFEGNSPNCWVQDGADQLDLEFNSGATPNANTGPSGDNTTGSGTYMYLNSSTGAQGDIANVTATVDLSGLTAPYLEFYYHMWGQNTGTLNIDVEIPAGSGNYINIWSQSGDQGDQWLLGETSLASFTNLTVGIRVQVVKGGGFAGSDIAVDDIKFKEAPTCIKPDNITLSNLTATSVDVAWSSTSGVTNIEYGPAGFTTGMGTALAGVTSPQSITGLTPTTAYEIRMVDDCSATSNGFSDTATVNFTTLIQGAQGVTCTSPNALSSVIFTEEFDNNNAGWTNIGTAGGQWEIPNGSGSLNTGADVAHSGASFMNFEATGVPVGDSGATVSPAIDLAAGVDAAELSFWIHAFGANMGDLTVGVGTSSAGPFTPVFVWSGQLQTSGADPWQNAGVDLSAYIGQVIYLEFSMSNVGGYTSDMSIDLVEVTTCVSCATPSALNISNVTQTGADVDWTSANTGNTFDIVVVPAGAPLDWANATNAAALPYTITGLSPCSAYDVYGRDNCGGGDVSVGLMGSFTTLPATVVPAPYFYGFEDGGNLNTCWTQDTADVLDWTIQTGPTGSGGTGPTGAVEGSYYAYVETSFPVVQGDSAILISPAIDVSSLPSPGLSFQYHMLGNDMGTLNVYAESPAGSGNLVNVFTLSGNQGNAWNLAEIPLTGLTSPIAIHFVGVAGASYTSDMSIDDFQVRNIACFTPSGFNFDFVSSDSIAASWNGMTTDTFRLFASSGGVLLGDTTVVGNTLNVGGIPEQTTIDFFFQQICGPGDTSNIAGPFTVTTLCNPLTAPFTEDFEDGGILDPCWAQSTADALDWTVLQGATGSVNTGPSSAASGLYYIYIETSGPAAGSDAIVESPEIITSGLTIPALNFNYHMWGALIGTLNVEVESPAGSGTWTNIWSLSGDQGDQWNNAWVDLSAYGSSIRLRFQAISGGSYTSDIAIDDVSVLEAPPAELAVIDLDAGMSGCGLGNETVTISVTNSGFSTVNAFDAGFNSNGSIVSETVGMMIAPGDTIDYTFLSNANFSAAGTYNLAAYVTAAGDPNSANDTMMTTISNSPIISTLPYNMSWEGGDAGWVSTGDWQLGAPAGGVINAASAGTNAWVTNLTGNYTNNSLDFLTSPCLDFSNETTDPVITAEVWYDIETDWDGGYFETSTDGGMTWTKLGGVAPNWYNNNNANGGIGDCWNGDGAAGSQGWVTVTHNLIGLAGASDARVRFVLESDGTQAREGLGVDNLSITAGFSCPSDLGLTITSTDVSVMGAADGTASISATGGMMPYSYLWTNGDSTTMIMGLTPGDYGVLVTDANGCTDSIGVTIGVACPMNLGLSTTTNPEIGQGTNTGTATVAASAGMAPYTYSWSNGATGDFVNGLAGDSATYDVVVTDANGCMDSATIMIETVFLTATNEIEGLRGLALTPNPTQDITLLQVEFEKAIDLTIEVVDITGKILQTRQEGQVISEQFRLDLSKYAAGTYFIKLSANGQTMARPVVLMK